MNMSIDGTNDPKAANTPARGACLTIFHDGSCPLCQREMAIVRKLRGAEGVAFTDVSQLAGSDAAPGLSAKSAMQRFHVRRADGTLLDGASAFIEMWTQSPRLRFLKPMQESPLALRLLNGIYAGFLVVRPAISRALGKVDALVGTSDSLFIGPSYSPSSSRPEGPEHLDRRPHPKINESLPGRRA